MPMTSSIYNIELHPSFLFTSEEYSNAKSNSLLPIQCSYCGEIFYRCKKEISANIKRGNKSFYCSTICSSNAHKKIKEETTYTCKYCGKIFTELPSKYASGDFCSVSCTKRYASQFSNTNEKKIEKSNTLKEYNKNKTSSTDKKNIKNPNLISTRKYTVIKICKIVLNKTEDITITDYNTVREIFINHLYTDNMSPKQIQAYYEIPSYKDFGNIMKTSFNIKLKSLSEAGISYYKRIGTYDNKSEKELYYKAAQFHFTRKDLPKVKGVELLEQYGMYNSKSNISGVSRDHMISIAYGWENNIPPEIISHPANCQFITQYDNSSKGKNCSITLEELYNRIENW